MSLYRSSTRHTSMWRRVAMASALVGIGLTGAAAPALSHAEHGHPARIHEGSCEALGRVAFRLNGVGASVDLDNAPLEVSSEVNPDKAYQVMLSNTLIDNTLDGLLAGDYAVMIYESDEEMNAISCGNLGGVMDGDRLVTGLAEMGIPGHLGFAVFTPAGDQTEVEVLIGHALAPMSASGGGDGEHADDEQSHAEPDDHDDAEDDSHDVAATPTP
jgi:hypothetical protein